MGSNKPTKRPNIPPTESQDFSEAVREVVQTLQGERGDPLDRAVTWRDLDREGFTDAVRRTGSTPRDSDRPPLGDGRDPEDRVVPPKPNGFGALGVFTSIVLSWSLPLYGNHARTLVFRNNTPSFGGASQIGSSPGQTYTDTVGTGVTRYYWIRFVSTDGVEGPPVGPASATTPINPEQALENVTDKVRNSGLFSLLRDEVKGVDTEKKADLLGDNWSVKVEDTINGETVVGGIGLAVNGPDAENPGTIDFGVVADNFWIANPDVDYSQEDRDIPFAIDTETGKVFISVAMIKDATITDAKIFDLRAEKLTVGAGGAIIAKGLLGQLAVTDAFISNRIESGGVVRDSNNEIVFENEGTQERPVLVPKFQSTFVSGSSGFRIDPRTGDAEFNNQKIRGILHNGALDSNGDVDFNQDPRFIDFRSGSPTEGDFQLGNVEGGNGISFKFEPAVGDRILRVRGDILLRNYEPGTQGTVVDAGSSQNIVMNQQPYAPTQFDFQNNDKLYWWPDTSLSYEGEKCDGTIISYEPANGVESDIVDPQENNTELMKEVVVTREGEIRCNYDILHARGDDLGFEAWTQYWLFIKPENGDPVPVGNPIENKLQRNQSGFQTLNVKPQDRIQLRVRVVYFTSEQVIDNRFSTPKLIEDCGGGIDNQRIELDNLALDASGAFGGGNSFPGDQDTEVLSFTLTVGFYLEEQTLL